MKKYLIIILICLIGISSSGCAVSQVLENKADNQKHAEEVIYTDDKDKIGITILTLHDENNKLLCRICYM